MEPAVKPAARASRSRKVAVLATAATLDGELFAATRAAHASGVEVLTVYPDDWVERVERGDVDSDTTILSVHQVIEPLLNSGVDEIVLGCTHYPFLIPAIEQISRGRAAILDPSTAVAAQTVRVSNRLPHPSVETVSQTFFTSGPADGFARVLEKLLGVSGVSVVHNPL
jgi:glutamate racemase